MLVSLVALHWFAHSTEQDRIVLNVSIFFMQTNPIHLHVSLLSAFS